MGKQNYKEKLIENGRLSGMSINKARNQNTNRFDSRLDARVKLLQKNGAKIGKPNLDARQLLLKKQQKARVRSMLIDKETPKKSKDPLVIVTGLGNVRKENGKLKVFKSSDHYVVDDRGNTVVTLKNDKAFVSDDEEGTINIDRSSNAKFQPIRIRIDNNLAKKAQPVRARQPQPAKPLEINKSGLYSSRLGSGYDEDMDYEEVPHAKSTHSHSHGHGHGYGHSASSYDSRRGSGSSGHNLDSVHSNSGFKLLISNLHPRVTEDDVLELFSDIGPIKRARFLDKGLAEVVYVKLDHAQEAIDKYDRNELDGRPMRIELVNDNKQSFDDSQKYNRPQSNASFLSSSSTAASFPQSNSRSLQTSSASSQPSSDYVKDSLSNKFKAMVGSKEPKVALPEPKKNEPIKVNVDSSIIHQVLFNKNKNTSSNPVTFTVKL